MLENTVVTAHRGLMKEFFVLSVRDVLLPQLAKYVASATGSKINLSFTQEEEEEEEEHRKLIFEASCDGKKCDFPTANVLRDLLELYKGRRLTEETILEVAEVSSSRFVVCNFQRNTVKSGRSTQHQQPRQESGGVKMRLSVSGASGPMECVSEEDVRLQIGYLLSTENFREQKFGVLCTIKVFESPLITTTFMHSDNQLDALLFTEKESKERTIFSTQECTLLELREKEHHKVYVTLFGPGGLINPCFGDDSLCEGFWASARKELNCDGEVKISPFCPRICVELPSENTNGGRFLLVRTDGSKESLERALESVKLAVSGKDAHMEKEAGNKEDEDEEDRKEGETDENLRCAESIAGSVASIITMSHNTDFRMKALMLIYGRLVSDSNLDEKEIKAAVFNALTKKSN